MTQDKEFQRSTKRGARGRNGGRPVGSGLAESFINGELVRSLRVDRGLTQNEVARLAHLSNGTISVIERRNQPLSPAALSRLASVFDLEAADLSLKSYSSEGSGAPLSKAMRALSGVFNASNLEAETIGSLSKSLNELLRMANKVSIMIDRKANS